MHPPAECRLFHAGRLLWPGLPLPRPYVAISLAKTLERMQAAGGVDSGRFHVSDWWLAKACLWNDPAGREVRERAWGHLMGATLAREGRLLSERLMLWARWLMAAVTMSPPQESSMVMATLPTGEHSHCSPSRSEYSGRGPHPRGN